MAVEASKLTLDFACHPRLLGRDAAAHRRPQLPGMALYARHRPSLLCPALSHHQPPNPPASPCRHLPVLLCSQRLLEQEVVLRR